MSAIWGIVDFNGKAVCAEDAEKMTRPFREKKIDRFDCWREGHLFMACGVQYFTAEAQAERFPYRQGGKALVADVVLDNRQQLAGQCAGLAGAATLPDGALLAECFFAGEQQAVRQLRGAYAFACYDAGQNVLHLVNDAMGTRFVYYHLRDGRAYFSSLLRPLLAVAGNAPFNERWFTDFFAIDSYIMVAEGCETPYANVFRLAPGQWVTLGPGGVQTRGWWQPVPASLGAHASDADYRDAFLQCFGACVQDTLRSPRQTGILLSGGLDSSAVAAFAAPALQQQGKPLLSFTSVPQQGYLHSPAAKGRLCDEAPCVRATQQMYPGIVPHFVQAPGQNAWDARDVVYKMLETPYKALPNMVWMLESCKQAAESGCKLVLNGQYGNITVSFGGFETLFRQLFTTGRWGEIWRQVNGLHAQHNVSRKALLRSILQDGLARAPSQHAFAQRLLVRHTLLQKHRVYPRLKQAGCLPGSVLDMATARACMVDAKALRQIGDAEMKLSLETGVLLRDPTRDPRLVELLLGYPLEQFVRGGVPNRLVRTHMQGLLPQMVTGNVFAKARQSADTVYRLQAHWPRVFGQLSAALAPGQSTGAWLRPAAVATALGTVQTLPQSPGKADALEFDIVRLMYHALACETLDGRR